MKLKQIPEDFIVDEIYDLEELKQKPQEKHNFFYFLLTKKDYTLFKALEKISNIFHTNPRKINFAGTKDRVGVTTQLISIPQINKDRLEKNLNYFNSKFNDLKLKFLGEFSSRLNLGDNKGNKFEITVRDLDEKDIALAKENIQLIKEKGVLNYFDEQRFGFAGNSHIIGKYILKNDLESAVKEILTSLPPNPREELVNFVNFVLEYWDGIKSSNDAIIEKAQSLTKEKSNEWRMLGFLKKHKNDFAGSFRILPKKLQTLYLNAYQSYIFNEILKHHEIDSGKLELVNSESKFEGDVKVLVERILSEDELGYENFNLTSMPELKLDKAFREVRIKISQLEISKEEKDELNSGKLKVLVSFSLPPGAYATNVIKQIFR
ncbi:MAG: tRNA pseudouridine(13) synthase TruD [Nanoarchaeota archaeon]